MAFFTLLPDRAVLRVSGADRQTFLQGLITNDVAALSKQRALFAALLTPQGKYLHDFILIERGDEILLEGEAARLEDLRSRLSRYRLRSTVTLEQVAWQVAVAWEEAAALLGLAQAQAGAVAPFGKEGLAALDPRLALLGVRVLSLTDPFLALQQTGCRPARPEDWHRHRMTLGVPQGSADLIPEKSLLLENRFDALNGIDWQKGCYLGQELTARTKYRALIKKSLFPVRLSGASLSGPSLSGPSLSGPSLSGPSLSGTPVFQGDRQVGEIRSALADRDGAIALAMLALEAATNPDLSANSRSLTVLFPEWLTRPEDRFSSVPSSSVQSS